MDGAGTEPDMRIELTDEEQSLLAQLSFDAPDTRSYEEKQKNGEVACALTKLLIARNAIPEPRWRFFMDPAYNVRGRGRSVYEVFERNGTCGDDIFRHAHFLRILWYFLNGAKLPASVITTFREAVENCGTVSSSDVIPLGKLARQLTRSHQLNSSEASEEFYRLSLDCGFWQPNARHIRDTVKSVR